jgi:chromosome segregation ATPase
MNTHVPTENHWVLMQAKELLDWATQTFPRSTLANGHLYRALSYHIQCSSQALPALKNDYNCLVFETLKLRAENKKLNDKVSTLDRECETLQDEVEDGKKIIANHVLTIDSYMENNSHLKEELRKVRERQNLAPSHDDHIASVSRLEEELYNARERLSTATATKEDITKELEGAREREAITSMFNIAINGQRKDHEDARYTLEHEKGALETGLKHTMAREDAANCKLDVTMRDLDIKIAEVGRLITSNADLSRRLCEQEQARLEADTSRKAAEDHCRALQDYLSGATTLMEDLKTKAKEVGQARSQAELEASTLQKQLDDEVKTTTELTVLVEQEKGESKARLEEEQTKLRESQVQQDLLTKELADFDATVQRLNSELEVALAQVSALEAEKANMSADLNRSKSCELTLHKALAEEAEAKALLDTSCHRLSQQVVVLAEKSDARGEGLASLREQVQQLRSALKDSYARTTTFEKDNTELVEALDSAREEHEEALTTALERHSEEMDLLKTDHSKLTRELELELLKMKTKAVRSLTADMGTNTLPSPPNSNSLHPNLDKAKPDTTNESTEDATALISNIHQKSSKNQQQTDSAPIRKPSDAKAPLEKANESTSTALRPEEIVHKPSTSPTVTGNPAVSKAALKLPPHDRRLAKAVPKTKRTLNANRCVIQTSAPSSKPEPIAVVVHAHAPDPTPLNKKHARAADCDEQEEPKMSKRARRRKRHRESLGAPATVPE